MEKYAAAVGWLYAAFILLVVTYFLLKFALRLIIKTFGAIKFVLFGKIEVVISKKNTSEFVICINNIGSLKKRKKRK